MPVRPGTPVADESATARWSLPSPLLFAVIFSAVWALHAPLLRLPYFWDEAGYFIPAARDLLLTGNPIPSSTLSNAHPPLVMGWLALWWKFSAFTPAVTRTAMLMLAAFALLGVFRLARQVSNTQVAIASTLLTAIFPVFFAQSSLAHLDMAAAAFTMWGLASYLAGNRWRCVVWLGLAGLAKETALIAPLALCVWELIVGRELVLRRRDGLFSTRMLSPFGLIPWRQSLMLLLSCVPLAMWLVYHYSQTGIVFGNPEYFRYNIGATLSPLRFVLALAQRLWQLLGYLNMFVLTGAAALAMSYAAPLRNGISEERPRIAVPKQLVFGVVVAAYTIALAAVGGAVIARYLLPAYPLVIIVCVSTLWRRLAWWPAAIAIAAAAFIAGLFVNPPYRIAPEDNLTYADYVRLHKQAAEKLAALAPAAVLTAWPAADELHKPYLGYVKQPIPVVAIENFSASQLADQQIQSHSFNYAYVFSTKHEPAYQLGGWWERMQTKYFDYHRDLSPEAAAAALGGKLIYEARRGPEWVAIVSR
ncbi:MAG: ArnT family glycosyltransferase [Terriglobales bacterium]